MHTYAERLTHENIFYFKYDIKRIASLYNSNLIEHYTTYPRTNANEMNSCKMKNSTTVVILLISRIISLYCSHNTPVIKVQSLFTYKISFYFLYRDM